MWMVCRRADAMYEWIYMNGVEKREKWPVCMSGSEPVSAAQDGLRWSEHEWCKWARSRENGTDAIPPSSAAVLLSWLLAPHAPPAAAITILIGAPPCFCTPGTKTWKVAALIGSFCSFCCCCEFSNFVTSRYSLAKIVGTVRLRSD